MDTGQYLLEGETWAYLGEGIMGDTDFAGLVRYTMQATDAIELLERAAAPK